ncbi:hypothetical protein L2E82_27459 [Cichorium intybus]|uniref:Uncharacterized protein n=1 Tax=Cichorium intybus TaxID=13427 RepID=A0ACB9CT97_CICIN|nr:hypothetical protein L2E82_27459 [Cichorium intybus]
MIYMMPITFCSSLLPWTTIDALPLKSIRFWHLKNGWRTNIKLLSKLLKAVKFCWYKRAQLALGIGDEDLARQALKRRKSYAGKILEIPAQDKLEHLFCLLSSVLPVIKQIHFEQCSELELERKPRADLYNNIVPHHPRSESSLI